MPIRNQRLYALAVVGAFVIAGCKQQPAPTQTSPSPAAADSSTSATATTSATTAANASSNESSPAKSQIDACKLLTSDEIKSVQSDTLKDVTPSAPGSGPFVTSQCFYATTNFVNSVSLNVTQQSPQAGAESLREFWKERFESAEHGDKERGRKREREKKEKRGAEEEEESRPPDRVKGIGDEAFSVGNAKIGAIYVLKGDKFLRISIGGSNDQADRIKKMKKLAQYALNRL